MDATMVVTPNPATISQTCHLSISGLRAAQSGLFVTETMTDVPGSQITLISSGIATDSGTFDYDFLPQNPDGLPHTYSFVLLVEPGHTPKTLATATLTTTA